MAISAPNGPIRVRPFKTAATFHQASARIALCDSFLFHGFTTTMEIVLSENVRTPMLPGEKLCTIAEESLDSKFQTRLAHSTGMPPKSATFDSAQQLRRHSVHQIYRSKSGKAAKVSYDYAGCQSRILFGPRKRSLFVEMGSRLRLFPAGGGVVSLAKAQSLSSFEVAGASSSMLLTTDSRSSTSLPKAAQRMRVSPRAIGSIVSLNHLSSDCAGGTAPSQLGMLCLHCSTQDIPCAKAVHIKQQRAAMIEKSLVNKAALQPCTSHEFDDEIVVLSCESSSKSCSLLSLSADSSSPSTPLCRICHCSYPVDPNDPLISPCRCSGTLQYVHVSCLMHWLDISSRKLHRPAICELCLYKYRRRRVLKLHMPDCPRADCRYYIVLLLALFLMLASALVTVFCFSLEKKYAPPTPIEKNASVSPQGSPAISHTAALGPIEMVEATNSTPIPQKTSEVANMLSTITLISAIVFFFAFFFAMYAHVKTGQSLCGYLRSCWSSNLDWSIDEYRISRDTQYLAKIEELRRRMNEKQAKKCTSSDEVQPLRTTVIAIE